MALRDKPPCEACKKLWGRDWDSDRCVECLPRLLPENQDPILIYTRVADQAIFVHGPAGSKVAALNHEAIHRAMDLYEVADRRGCFEAVLTLFRELVLIPQEENS